jgi:hypothetical protein
LALARAVSRERARIRVEFIGFLHSGTVSVAEQISASRRISNDKADSSTSSTAPLSLLMKSARDFARLAIVRGSGRCRVRQLGRDFVVDVILRNRSGTPNHVDSEFL